MGTELLLSQYCGCQIAELYNSRRPHSALDGSTPDEFYYRNLPALQEAA